MSLYDTFLKKFWFWKIFTYELLQYEAESHRSQRHTKSNIPRFPASSQAWRTPPISVFLVHARGKGWAWATLGRYRHWRHQTPQLVQGRCNWSFTARIIHSVFFQNYPDEKGAAGASVHFACWVEYFASSSVSSIAVIRGCDKKVEWYVYAW